MTMTLKLGFPPLQIMTLSVRSVLYMAPNVSTSRKKEAMVSKRKETMAMMNKAAQTIRKEIEEKCDYVGERFADEAPALFITARKRSVLFMAKPVRKRRQSSKRKGSALRLCQMF